MVLMKAGPGPQALESVALGELLSFGLYFRALVAGR